MTTPRARGTNPRARGTNARARGTNPRAERNDARDARYVRRTIARALVLMRRNGDACSTCDGSSSLAPSSCCDPVTLAAAVDYLTTHGHPV